MEVKFNTSIQRSNIKKSLEFSISATWSLGGIPMVLTGGISDGESLKERRLLIQCIYLKTY
jgi:hypothetical protein